MFWTYHWGSLQICRTSSKVLVTLVKSMYITSVIIFNAGISCLSHNSWLWHLLLDTLLVYFVLLCPIQLTLLYQNWILTKEVLPSKQQKIWEWKVNWINNDLSLYCIQIFFSVHCVGLWKGLGARILMIGTLTGLQWFIYDSVKVYFRIPRPPPPIMPESLKKKLEAANTQ